MSVEHILKTAFKDVVDEETRGKNAEEARKAMIDYLEEDVNIRSELQSKLKQSAEAEAVLLLDIEKSKDPKAKKPPPPKKGEPAGPSPTELLEMKLQQLLAQRKADIDAVNARLTPEEKFPAANYKSHFQQMSLDENLKSKYDETIQVISKRLDESQVVATSLTDFLVEKREVAHDQEVDEEDKLKRQGILVGQHIPSLKSMLQLKQEDLSSFDHFSSNLILAGDLICENRRNNLRRTGNLPISDLAEAKILARTKRKPVDTSKPNYTLNTFSSTKREDRIRVQFSETFQILDGERMAASANKTMIPRRIPNRDYGLSAAQLERNGEILRGINHKLNYLRNPRNDSAYLSRMLIKNEATFQIYEDGAAPPSPPSSLDDDKNGDKGKENIANQAHLESSSDHYKHKRKTPSHNPLFVAVPSVVKFVGYEPEIKYTKTICFKNVSSISRMVAVTGPSTSFFKMGPLSYPANCPDGIIAPGLSVQTSITFSPDKIGVYGDSMELHTESGSFKVPIKVTREKPELIVPPMILANPGLIGDATRTAVVLKNIGGSGSFRICRPGDYDPDNPSQMLDAEDIGCIRDAPFTLYPVQFELEHSKSISLNIEFVPLEVNSFQRDFVIVNDNNQVIKFSISSKSNEVKIAIQEINQILFDNYDSRVKRDMFFSEANIGSEELQTISITNDTGSPITYEWVFLSSDCRNLNKSASKKITDRESQDAYFLQTQPNASMFGKKLDSDTIQQMNNTTEDLGNSNPNSDAKIQPKPPALNAKNTGSKRSQGKSTQSKLPSPGFSSKNSNNDDNSNVDFEGTATSTLMRPNNITEGGFVLSPARGVIPCDGLQTFKVSFNPISVNRSSLKAAFVVKEVPFASVPDKKQADYLNALKLHGHGELLRLSSWLDELGTSARVDEYKKNNGTASKTAKLNNLRNILDLVSSHAVNQVEDPLSLLTLNKHVRDILLHIKKWKMNDLDIAEEDDDATNNNSHSATSLKKEANGISSGRHLQDVTLLPMYWKGSGGSFMNPTKVYPVTLNADFSFENNCEQPLSPTNDSVANFSIPSGGINEYSSSLTLAVGAKKELADAAAADARAASPVSVSSKIRFDLTDNNQGIFISDLTEEDKQLMSEVWFGANDVIKLLGPSLCNCLDALVKHEAIDYLRSISLSNVVSLSVDVAGVGQPQKLIVQPLHLFVPGDITIGRPFHATITVFNPSSSMIDVDALIENLIIDNFTPFPDYSASDQIQLSITPQRILVMPESRASFDITLISRSIGSFHLKVPLAASNIRDVVIDPIHISFNCIGPTIRYNCSEVDTGLIGCGFDATRLLTFTNEGEMPVMYQIKCDLEQHSEVEFSAIKVLGSARKSPRPDSARSHGRDSVKSSGRRSSEADTNALMASESSNLVPDHTCVFMSPPAGTIQPFETAEITVTTKAGKRGDRVRGTIECKVFDASGHILIDTKCLTFRGEVQSPQVRLYPMSFDLGTVYIGVPVKFQFTIENMRNLPSRFKVERPGGDSSMFEISYDKQAAPLNAKEKVLVTATFLAKAVGALDEIFAAKVFGLMLPLGFSVKAVIKSISMEYSQFKQGDGIPNSLSPEALLLQPEPKPIEPFEVGTEVAIYERRQIKFLVRNFSPIPTTFNVSLKRFQALGNTSTLLQEFHCEEDSNQGRTDMLMVAHEDGENKFKSRPGKAYIGERELRKRDKRYLSSNLGASYLVEPSVGSLPGWGVQVITVNAFNSMPGCYDDNIEFEYMDNNILRRSLIPLKMSVIGCPFIIDKNTLGVSPIHAGSIFPEKFIGELSLNLGDGCVMCDAFTKEVTIRNNGSQPGLIRWRMSPVESTAKGLIKVNIDLSRKFASDGKAKDGQVVKTIFKFWNDLYTSDFKVEPSTDIIPPFGSQTFKVTMANTANACKSTALMKGMISLLPNSDKNSLSHKHNNGSASVASLESKSSNGSKKALSRSASAANLAFNLNLLLQSEIMHPVLKIDKSIYQVGSNEVVAPDAMSLRFKAKASLLFGQSDPSEVSKESHHHRKKSSAFKSEVSVHKQLTITNPLDAFLSFNVSTEGSFVLKNLSDDHSLNHHIRSSSERSARKPSNSSVGADKLKRPGSERGGGGGSTLANSTDFSSSGSIVGKFIRLNPHSSSSFIVEYAPRREIRDNLLSSVLTDKAKETNESGNLVFSFNTGQTLRIPLHILIASPFIVSSSPRLNLGICHTTKSCSGLILLSNLTDVPAYWTITHVVTNKVLGASSIRVKGYEPAEEEVDDPEVFTFSPTSGTLEGPTVSTSSAAAAPPKDLVRFPDQNMTIVPQRVTQTSWSNSVLTMKDSLQLKFEGSHKSPADAYFPVPVTITFKPKSNHLFSCRFRVSCQYGNSFDILLQAKGTFEENLHAPTNPVPR